MRTTLGKLSTIQNLSSESLFHFTSSIDVLYKILRNGFQARYIYEKIPGTKLAYYVKTTCFCDIPLGAIKNHINWYGQYGIGINRAWGKDHKISPVTYIHSNSPLLIKSSSEKYRKYLEKQLITPFLKQVRGKQYFTDSNTGESYYKWKTFYDEREWRYFPDNYNLSVKKYKREAELEQYRTALNNSSLPYLILDSKYIEYIIVNDNEDITPLISRIKKLIKKHKEQDILITKILTTNQIHRDF